MPLRQGITESQKILPKLGDTFVTGNKLADLVKQVDF
jgi:hypothetical protein